MKVTIKYSHGTPGGPPFDASIKLPDGEYACGSGWTIQEAKERVITRAKEKLKPIPGPEEVDI